MEKERMNQQEQEQFEELIQEVAKLSPQDREKVALVIHGMLAVQTKESA